MSRLDVWVFYGGEVWLTGQWRRFAGRGFALNKRRQVTHGGAKLIAAGFTRPRVANLVPAHMF
jgi:hypothetical protein